MFDLATFVKAIGYLGIFGIIFAESGLFFGFFFPGDSLLFTAGFLASQGLFNIWWLVLGCFVAAVAGVSTGYAFGWHFGPRIFKREDSFFFHKKHLERAQAFYVAHGGKAIVLGRFVPIVRTFAPIVAGIGRMNYIKFLFYNVIGGMLWSVGLPLFGYYLGRVVPEVDHYLLPIVFGIIALSLLPSLRHLRRT